MTFFKTRPLSAPSPCPDFPFRTSLLRLLLRGPALLRLPVPPLVFVALGGCFNPEGARIEPTKGEGEDCEERAPFRDV